MAKTSGACVSCRLAKWAKRGEWGRCTVDESKFSDDVKDTVVSCETGMKIWKRLNGECPAWQAKEEQR